MAANKSLICCVAGCGELRHVLSSTHRSRFCLKHYHERDRRVTTCKLPLSVTTDEALAVLHEYRPLRPIREYPKDGKQDFNVRPFALKHRRARIKAGLLVRLRGGQQPPAPLNEVSRTRAWARLEQLTRGDALEGKAS